MAFTWNLSGLRAHVRFLTAIYSDDIVANSYLDNEINEAYFELAASQASWSWTTGGSVAGLTESTAPLFDNAFALLLPYKVAAKVLRVNGDTSGRVEQYTNSYNELVAGLKLKDLDGRATGYNLGIANDTRLVRDLLGVYDYSLSNTYISRQLMQAAAELGSQQEWPWGTDDITNDATYLTFTSGFNCPYLVVYKAAINLAPEVGADANKVQTWQSRYDSLYEQEINYNFKRLSVININNTSKTTQYTTIKKAVRNVLNVWDNTISDDFIYTKLCEEYKEFKEKYSANYTWDIYSTTYSPVENIWIYEDLTVATFQYNNLGLLVDTVEWTHFPPEGELPSYIYDTGILAVDYDDTPFTELPLGVAPSWPTQTTLDSFTDFSKLNPYHISEIGTTVGVRWYDNHLLVYGVAVRIATALGMPENVIKAAQAEHDTILERIKKTHFTNNTLNQTNFFQGLVQRAQTYANAHDSLLSNSLLNKMLWDENVILTNEREWSFLRQTLFLTLPPNTTSFNIANLLSYTEFDAIDRIQMLNMFTLNADGSNREAVLPHPNLLNIEPNNKQRYYKVDNIDGTTVILAPSSPQETKLLIEFKFTNDNVSIDFGGSLLNKKIQYAPQFHDIIVYRLAAKLCILNDDANMKNKVPMFMKMADDLRDSMISYYDLEHSAQPLQLNTGALEQRKYIPFFRVG